MRSELETDFFTPPLPRVMAHRGASGEYPENTLAAFARAVDAGAIYLELDVHSTRDGDVAVTHDENLMRIGSHDKLIAEMTTAELETVDAGFNFSCDGLRFPFRGSGMRVPKLSEVLSTWPQQLFVIEFKPLDPAIADATLEVVRRMGIERRVLFASEHLPPIERVRTLAPQIPTNLPAPEILHFMQLLAPGSPPDVFRGDALQVPPEHAGWKLVIPETVAAAHRKGLEIHVFTINEEAETMRLLQLGVDGIITDYPARLLTMLEAR
jgi:glycerophosphoryl diester phosphodiesterase